MLETSNLISDLISSGADANKNLYTVSFKKKGDSGVAFPETRVVNVTLPVDASNSINIDYKNVKIPIISPNTNLQRTLKITVRESELLDIYKYIKGDATTSSHMAIDSSGDFILDRSNNNSLMQVTVTYYKPRIFEGKGQLEEVIQWNFYDCYILDMGTTFTLNYDSGGGPLTYPINIIFKNMESQFSVI